jgi:hypothetical protein
MRRAAYCFLLSSVLSGCFNGAPADLGTLEHDQTPQPGAGSVGNTHESSHGALVSERLPDPPSAVTFVDRIAACSWGPGRLDLFAVATDGAIWHLSFDGSWHSWSALSAPGTADTGISASMRGTSAIDLFYRDAASQRLGHLYLEGDSDWQRELVGASPISKVAPSAVSSSDARIDVFTQGAGFTLSHIWRDDTWAADWVTESEVSGVGSAPTVTSSGANRFDVFWAQVGSSHLGHWWFGGTSHFFDWHTGDALSSAPAAASRASSLLDVLFLSQAQPSTLIRCYYAAGWASASYELPGAAAGTEIASVSWGPGRLDLFYFDAAGAIEHALVPGESVLTQHNDIARTGGNTGELDLNVDNVGSGNFGPLFTIPVDGNVWAQPLYQATLDLSEQGQGIRNTLYVATANDSVYLFDADTGDSLAHVSLGNPVPVPFADFTTGSGSTEDGDECRYNMLPQIGITSTPVLDPSTNTLYVVALSADEELTPEPIAECAIEHDPSHVYRVQLHALDSRTLAERAGSPVTVAPSFTYQTKTIDFTANRHLQRPSLLLSQGKVYLAFGSYTDRPPYFGWVVSYDAATLEQRDVFVDTPEGALTGGGGKAGIWQSGQGLTADADGNVYLFTGNGSIGKSYQYSNSALELSSSLDVVSAFRPYNADLLDQMDLDLSSSGAMLVPDTNFVMGGGKEGRMYVMTRGDLGSSTDDADDVAYSELVGIPGDDCGEDNGGISNLHGGTVYWKSDNGTANVYLMGEADFAKKLEFDETSGAFTVAAQSNERAPCGMPGGFLSVSSDHGNPRTAIIWANVPTLNSVADVVPASFYAFNAETLETIYQDESRAESPSKFAKFVAPTVANGKVYQAAFGAADSELGSLNDKYSGSIVVYGLKSR